MPQRSVGSGFSRRRSGKDPLPQNRAVFGSIPFLNQIPGVNTALGEVDDVIDGGKSEKALAAQEQDTALGGLSGLRGRIPTGGMTPEEFAQSPEGQALLQRFGGAPRSMEELTQFQTAMARAGNTPQDIEYGTVDPESLDYVSDDLQGYEATLMDGTAFDNLQGQEEREGYGRTQQSALDRVLGIANEGGLTAIDRARIAEQRAGEEQWLRGQRGATLANMEARGMGGSGAELASIFDSQQSSANRNAMSGTQIEALAQQRQDQALRDSFGMSTDARSQSFGEASDIASAQDRTNQWNSQLGTDQARYLSDVMNQGAYTDSGTRNQNTYDTRDQGDRGMDATREEGWRRFGADADITGQEVGIHQGAAQQAATEGAQDSQFFRNMAANLVPRPGGGGNAPVTQQQLPAFTPGGYKAPYAPPQSGGYTPPVYQPPQRSDLIDPWADPEDDD